MIELFKGYPTMYEYTKFNKKLPSNFRFKSACHVFNENLICKFTDINQTNDYFLMNFSKIQKKTRESLLIKKWPRALSVSAAVLKQINRRNKNRRTPSAGSDWNFQMDRLEQAARRDERGGVEQNPTDDDLVTKDGTDCDSPHI